jgi:hypothetical protein
MVATFCFVVIVVVFLQERRVFRQGIDYTATELILSVLQVFQPLGTHIAAFAW